MPAFACVEGAQFTLPAPLHQPLRAVCAELELRLRPSITPILEERGGHFTIRGIIGTAELRPNVLLDIVPKTEPEDDWITAALDLLLRETRIAISGDRRGGLAAYRNLLDVLAVLYSERLGRALRRDGPILVMERRSDVPPLLKGKLGITRWSREAAWRPHKLPVSFLELTADNAYTRGLAYVAEALGRATRDPQVRGRLLTYARELRPGAPPQIVPDATVASRPLPAQWGAYSGAWDIAVSVLARKTLLGSRGQRQGVSMTVEAWGLLETMLARALAEVVRLALHDGRVLASPGKTRARLITPSIGSLGKRRSVEPDGRLLEGTKTVATFEAKYTRGLGLEPDRTHVFQALSTAAACGSPLTVLVYPDEFAPVWWQTRGFNERPKHLVAIGLHLFGYGRGAGDRSRGRQLYDLLGGPAVGSDAGPLGAAA